MKVSELLSKATPQPVTRAKNLGTIACNCGHAFIRHEGDTGGHCMDCGCMEFSDAVRSN